MSEFGIEEARRLLDADWRQGSTFRADAKIAAMLGIAEGTNVIVLSQSCVVVSGDLVKDPRVEIACLQDSFEQAYSESHEGAVGKLRTKLHVQLDGNADGDRFVLDINTRQFIPRELLLDIDQDAPRCSVDQADRIAGWISRSYTRSAWPNRLVEIFRDTKVKTKLEKALKAKLADATLYSGTRSIFARWEPEIEAESYALTLDFVTVDEVFAAELERVIWDKFKVDSGVVFKNENLEVTVRVSAADTVFLNDFDGSRRMTEWDVFTDLAEQLD